MSYLPPKPISVKRPGNYGGETYREYCGLSKRRVSYFKERHDAGGVSAQAIYVAIGKHTKKKGHK